MTKQQILDQIKTDNTDEETISELSALVEQYPEELDENMVSELADKVDQYVADNALLEKAYRDMDATVEEFMETTLAAEERAMNSLAQTAYDDLSQANEMLADAK